MVLGFITLFLLQYIYESVEKERRNSGKKKPINILLIVYTHPYLFIRNAIRKRSFKDITVMITVIIFWLLMQMAVNFMNSKQ